MTEQSNIELSIQNPIPSVAGLFIKTREQQGYSIEYVGHHLRVSQSYIEAIESNNVAAFPARVYILGFVRSYAIFLKLDPNECCKRFKSEVLGEQTPDPILNFPTMLTLESSPSNMILKISLGLLVIILAAGVFIGQWSSPVTDDIVLDRNRDVKGTSEGSLTDVPNTTPEKKGGAQESSQQDQSSNLIVPDTQDRHQPSLGNSQNSLMSLDRPKTIAVVDPKASETSTSLTQQGSPDICFTFTQECWLKIQDAAQQVLIEKTFQTGEQYRLPVRNNYTLHTGNAGGIEISGPEMSPKILGKKGQVLANLSLDSGSLSAYLNQQ